MTKALTLTQPWATLVALGIKTVETRSWRANYRGPLLIHAAKGWTSEDRSFAVDLQVRGILPTAPDRSKWSLQSYPLGAIVATATLFTAWRTSAVTSGIAPLSRLEKELGDYGPDRWAWFLTDVVALPEPIPWRGALGLWDGPDL